MYTRTRVTRPRISCAGDHGARQRLVIRRSSIRRRRSISIVWRFEWFHLRFTVAWRRRASEDWSGEMPSVFVRVLEVIVRSSKSSRGTCERVVEFSFSAWRRVVRFSSMQVLLLAQSIHTSMDGQGQRSTASKVERVGMRRPQVPGSEECPNSLQ